MNSNNNFKSLAVRKKQTKIWERRFAFICSAAISFTAMAEGSTVKQFNIPAQSLQTALNQFSATADMQMSYPAALAEGVTTSGVAGKYTSEQALKVLLEGSGLVPKVINNTVTIKQPNRSALTVENLLAAADEMDYPEAAAESDYQGAVEQEDLTVSGWELSGYSVLMRILRPRWICRLWKYLHQYKSSPA